MNDLRIPIQGSSGLYEILLEWNGGRLRVLCDCKAGTFGQLCKHKTSLLAGDASIIAVADSDEADGIMAKAHALMDRVGREALEAFSKDMRSLEAEKTRIEKLLKSRKAAFARQLAEGLPGNGI